MTQTATTGLLKQLFESGRRRNYAKGELVLRAGDTPQGVYMIDTGIVKVFSLSKHQNEHVHHFFGSGDFFPVTWAFQGVIRPLYYEALGPVTVSVVSRSDFLDFVSHNANSMMQVLGEIIERYRQYAGRIDNLLYSDAKQRSAHRLLSLAHRFGKKTVDGIVIDANLTHEDLAHSINMTRETFGRTFGRLQERGIIGYDAKRHLVIKNLPALVGIIGREESEQTWPELMQYLD